MQTEEQTRHNKLLTKLGKMARRWKRSCGRPGGACVQTQEANYYADSRVKECVKELESLLSEYV